MKIITVEGAKFPLGAILTSHNLKVTLEANGYTVGNLAPLLARHMAGDWGDVDSEDSYHNEQALEHGGRLFSVYVDVLGVKKIWIITEANREYTTCILPEDY